MTKVRVRLLNDGGYEGLRRMKFPIDVDADLQLGAPCVDVTGSDLISAGADDRYINTGYVYYFSAYELIPAGERAGANLYLERIHPDAMQPTRATTHAAGMDVSACFPTGASVSVYGSWSASGSGPEKRIVVPDSPLVLMPGERALIPTGWKMCCDTGWCIKLYPRSGLSVKRGLSLVNCVAVLDSDYRGEVFVALVNLDSAPQVIEHGDRLCQLMLERVEQVAVVEGVLPAADSNRAGGFGSTGV